MKSILTDLQINLNKNASVSCVCDAIESHRQGDLHISVGP